MSSETHIRMTEEAAAPDFSFSALLRAYRDPHALYSALRTFDPIYFDEASQFWLVTGHAEVVAILGDERFSSAVYPPLDSAGRQQLSFLQASIQRQVIFLEGEMHDRVQSAIFKQISRSGRESAALIQRIVCQLLAQLQKRDCIDLVQDFAVPLSLLVVSELLGVPTSNMEELQQLAQWSNAHGDLCSGYLRKEIRDVEKLGHYFRRLVAEARHQSRSDLLHVLLDLEDHYVHPDDLVVNCMMVFGAGRMTTQKVLSNGLPQLMPRWSHWRAAQKEDPEFSKRATEELLRLVTPTRYVMRQALTDVELSDQFPGEHHILEGDKVILFLEAANRDPQVFDSPHDFIPDRPSNRHLSFGYGKHFCSGAKLARLEIQLAMELLFETFPELKILEAEPYSWESNPNLGGYEQFRFCPAGSTSTVPQGGP